MLWHCVARRQARIVSERDQRYKTPNGGCCRRPSLIHFLWAKMNLTCEPVPIGWLSLIIRVNLHCGFSNLTLKINPIKTLIRITLSVPVEDYDERFSTSYARQTSGATRWTTNTKIRPFTLQTRQVGVVFIYVHRIVCIQPGTTAHRTTSYPSPVPPRRSVIPTPGSTRLTRSFIPHSQT